MYNLTEVVHHFDMKLVEDTGAFWYKLLRALEHLRLIDAASYIICQMYLMFAGNNLQKPHIYMRGRYWCCAQLIRTAVGVVSEGVCL